MDPEEAERLQQWAEEAGVAGSEGGQEQTVQPAPGGDGVADGGVSTPASPLQKSSVTHELWGGMGSVTAEGTPFQRFSRWWHSLAEVAR